MQKIIRNFVLTVALTYLSVTAQSYAAELSGAGATFVYPLYSKLFDTYAKETGVQVNYQSIGSGAGIQQLLNKTVDFGASDAFMSDSELSTAGKSIVHIPICLGAVAMTYNLPGISTLKLSPAVIDDIFEGKITMWNDPKIQALNPETKNLATRIVVVHRSDGSGTTFIFTDYLSKISESWKNNIGVGKSVNWPVGIGGKGNEGVAGLVRQIPGAFGYIEQIYANQNKMPVCSVQNQKGKFITPTLESISAAASQKIPEDSRVSLTNTSNPNGYPIAGFSWVLVYQDLAESGRNKDQSIRVAQLIKWMITEGQKFTKPLDYAPLSPDATKIALKIVDSLNYQGKSVSIIPIPK